MKPFITFAVFLLFLSDLYAQDGMNLPLSVVIPYDGYDDAYESRSYLKTKLQQYIAEDAVGEIVEDFSFLVYPKMSVIGQELTSSTPQMYVIDIDLALFVSNSKPVNEVTKGVNQTNIQSIKQILFNSKSFSLKGVGTSKEKAFMNAFQNLNKHKVELKEFFKASRYKIFIYFKENCDAMIKEAEMLAKEAHLSLNILDQNSTTGSVASNAMNSKEGRAEQKFASGLLILKNLRLANTQCYDAKTDKINEILNMYDEYACNQYFSMAKNQWAKRDTAKTIAYLDKIPPSKKCKAEMEVFLEQIGKYVDSHDTKSIDNKIKLWKEAGGLDKAKIDGEAYKYLQSSTMEIRRLEAQNITNKDLLILK